MPPAADKWCGAEGVGVLGSCALKKASRDDRRWMWQRSVQGET